MMATIIKQKKPREQKLVTKNCKSNAFISDVINDCALAYTGSSDNFDADSAIQYSKDGLVALEAKGGLQTMLASQMMGVHKMQQTAIFLATRSHNTTLQQYYTNAAIKLTNCFTQQANVLAKLQSLSGSKITVERVDVHDGGQAVVGNVIGYQTKEQEN